MGPSADSSMALRKCRLEGGQVVAVDRADISHAEGLEEGRRLQQLSSGGLHRLDRPLRRIADERDVAHEFLELALAPHVHGVQADVGEEVRQDIADPADDRRRFRSVRRRRALRRQVGDRRRVAPTVVVEDDDDPLAGVAEVVQRLVRHPTGHRSVADDGDDVTVISGAQIAGDRQAVGVAEDRRGVRALDEVVLALGA